MDICDRAPNPMEERPERLKFLRFEASANQRDSSGTNKPECHFVNCKPGSIRTERVSQRVLTFSRDGRLAGDRGHYGRIVGRHRGHGGRLMTRADTLRTLVILSDPALPCVTGGAGGESLPLSGLLAPANVL